jgi:hypothetical protein
MSDVSQNVKDGIQKANEHQRNAIDSVLEGWQGKNGEFIFPIIEGPPGTGKTTVGVLSAARYVLECDKSQIAYLTYTNYSAEKAREDFIRLGFDAKNVIRLTPNPGEKDWARGIVGCGFSLQGLTENDKRVLRKAPVLISTLYSSGRIFKVHKQPLIMIDEFSQVDPTLYFSTLSKVRKTTEYNPSGYVLLGDPNQLPVITSQPLLRPNVGVFIFARKSYQPHQLTTQYRMHQDICEVVNALRAALNTYSLKSDASVQRRALKELGYMWNGDNCPTYFREILNPEKPCVIVNTDYLPGQEKIGFGKSTYYPEEAMLAARLATALYQSYKHVDGNLLLPTILSPYNAQIGNIQSCLQNPQLQTQCITIYKAQGREYPSVIISFTRKNPMGWIGFLKEPQMRAQTYVACSRAMAKLIILLSFSTFLGHGHRDFEFLMARCSSSALIIDADPRWSDKND